MQTLAFKSLPICIHTRMKCRCRFYNNLSHIFNLFSNGTILTNDFDISRLIAASATNSEELLGKDLNEKVQIESALNSIEDLSRNILSIAEFIKLTKSNIEKAGFVVLNRITLADLLLWAVIETNEKV